MNLRKIRREERVKNKTLSAAKSAKNDEFYTLYADHVTPWSKGGAMDIKNCQMLCRTHNRAKGNR